jgi:hypothetical protein
MAPKPAAQRRTAHAPQRGDWQAVPGIGWQHGPIPAAPPRLLKASREAWAVWFGAWYAAHWRPEDLPALRQVIRLYDRVERGDYPRATELRLAEDTWGITPKGQQDRRWAAPKTWEEAQAELETAPEADTPSPPPSRYGHLRTVGA